MTNSDRKYAAIIQQAYNNIGQNPPNFINDDVRRAINQYLDDRDTLNEFIGGIENRLAVIESVSLGVTVYVLGGPVVWAVGGAATLYVLSDAIGRALEAGTGYSSLPGALGNFFNNANFYSILRSTYNGTDPSSGNPHSLSGPGSCSGPPSPVLGTANALFNDAKLQPLPRGGDPLVLDFNDNGSTSKALTAGSVYFDSNGDGIKERSGWIEQGDALLAIDRNHNGRIDNGTELFGNAQTPGFDALTGYDSNRDGYITSADVEYANILLWFDNNLNGVTDIGELINLSDAGVTRISLAATDVDVNENGNYKSRVSNFETIDGKEHQIAELFFKFSGIETDYSDNIQIQDIVEFAPDLRGYGALPNLQLAASVDLELFKQLCDISWDINVFSTFDSRLEELLYRWAQVEDIPPDSRGGQFDARKLAFLEALYNEPFLQFGQQNPLGNAVLFLEQSWSQIFEHYKLALLIQGPFANLFPDAAYDPGTDSLNGVFDLTKLKDLVSELAVNLTDVDLGWWSGVAETMTLIQMAAGGDLSLVDSFVNQLLIQHNVEVAYDDLVELKHLTGSDFGDALDARSSGKSIVAGNGGDDHITGSSAGDILLGGLGDDIISGGGGSDRVEGGAGGDIVILDGSGSFASGGTGNDRFVFDLSGIGFGGAGSIDDFEGAGIAGGDAIQIINSTVQMRFSFLGEVIGGNLGGSGDGIIAVGYVRQGGGISIYVDADDDGRIDAGDVRIDLPTASNLGPEDFFSTFLVVTGTPQDDDLSGSAAGDLIAGLGGNDLVAGNGGDDEISGGLGNDTIRGLAGDDRLLGDLGVDRLEGGDGNDQLEGGADADTLLGDAG
ncbi:MAG: calcium-binding protein, partial [Inquilinus sp.]|uniref:calcium-binding protein n=1 Tax=Inquilinus sp. TaxID=1932117 RepID=UPI003F363F9B